MTVGLAKGDNQHRYSIRPPKQARYHGLVEYLNKECRTISYWPVLWRLHPNFLVHFIGLDRGTAGARAMAPPAEKSRRRPT